MLLLTLYQVVLHRLHDLHVHDGVRSRGDLFSFTPQWFNLRLGGREFWA